MEGKKKNWKAALSLLIVSLMLLTASGGLISSSMAESVAPEENATGVESTVIPGEKGILEFWSVLAGADSKHIQKMVDAYNATGPAYTVNHRPMAEGDLYLKMPLAVQSGQDVPDVAINHVERLNLFVKDGIITDLTTYLQGSAVVKDNYTSTLWEASDIDGGHYAVPLDSTGFVTFVNMDLYEKYGGNALDDGALTWDEIKAAGQAMEGEDVIAIGLGWLRANWLSGYGQLGGKMTLDGEEPTVTDEPSVQVLNKWREMHDAGYTQKDGDAAWDLFVGGKMLYMPEGSWMLSSVLESGLNYQMTSYPVFDPAVKGHWTSSHQFVIPKNDSREEEKNQAVIDFVNFMGENSMTWAEAGQIPAHISVTGNPAFKDMPQYFISSDSEALKVFTYPYYGYVVESMDKVLIEILFGRMSVEDGLAQAEQEIKDRIAIGG